MQLGVLLHSMAAADPHADAQRNANPATRQMAKRIEAGRWSCRSGDFMLCTRSLHPDTKWKEIGPQLNKLAPRAAPSATRAFVALPPIYNGCAGS